MYPGGRGQGDRCTLGGWDREIDVPWGEGTCTLGEGDREIDVPWGEGTCTLGEGDREIDVPLGWGDREIDVPWGGGDREIDVPWGEGTGRYLECCLCQNRLHASYIEAHCTHVIHRDNITIMSSRATTTEQLRWTHWRIVTTQGVVIFVRSTSREPNSDHCSPQSIQMPLLYLNKWLCQWSRS